MRKSLPILLVLLLAGCGPQESNQQFFAMDTAMVFTAYGPAGGTALAKAQAELFRLDALLSRTRPESDIARLNDSAGGGPVALDPSTAELLRTAKQYAADTGNAFDPTIAPLMVAWGFSGSGAHRVPSQAERAALLALVGAEGLSVTAGGEASLGRPGMAADLGGIAKGYAADRAAALLREDGVTAALLDLGNSTIAALGLHPDGTPWRIGVKNPETQEGYLCIQDLSDQFLSTSGAYQRFFDQDGTIYHHILDPKTGAPASSDLLSATVVAANGTLADAYSTAIFVMGSNQALELWRNRSDLELILIRADKTILVTEGLEPGFTFRGEEAGYAYEIVRR